MATSCSTQKQSDNGDGSTVVVLAVGAGTLTVLDKWGVPLIS
jgi:hypothetical protein